MDPPQLAQRFPWLAVDGLGAGSFGARHEGWIDPVLWMTALRNRALVQGARVVRGRVVGQETVTGGTRLTLAAGAEASTITARQVVVAAGPASGTVAALFGVRVPVEPRKRYVYIFDCRDCPKALHKGPLTVDPSGVWFRPEGRVFIGGVSPEDHNEPPAENLDHIDDAEFEDVVWPALAARVPVFEKIKRVGAWAGFYDYNTLDQNAIIGALPKPGGRSGFRDDVFIVTGFSGHGLQQGFAAGRAIAELIVDGRFSTIDLTRFGMERIVAERPLLELNII